MGKHVLFTGCAHSGIGNMMRQVQKTVGIDHFDIVIGGFHLFNPVTRTTEPRSRMDKLVVELDAFSNTIFYTGHCTGEKAFKYLKKSLGDRIRPFRTGSVIRV